MGSSRHVLLGLYHEGILDRGNVCTMVDVTRSSKKLSDLKIQPKLV